MNDQAFPGQPLNDEWLFADPEQLILIRNRAENHEKPRPGNEPGEKYSQALARIPRHS